VGRRRAKQEQVSGQHQPTIALYRYGQNVPKLSYQAFFHILWWDGLAFFPLQKTNAS